MNVGSISFLAFYPGLKGLIHLTWTLPCTLIIMIFTGVILKKVVYDTLKKIENGMLDLSHGEVDLTRKLDIVRKNEFGIISNCFNI